MAVGIGGNSWILAAEQTSKGTLAAWADYRKWIYQFTGGGIGLTGDFSTFDANKGSLAPSPQILGQVGSEGTINIAHDAESLGFWLKQIMRKAPTSTQLSTLLASVNRAEYNLISAPVTLNPSTLSVDIPTASDSNQPLSIWDNSAIPDGVNAMKLSFRVTTAVDLGTEEVVVTVNGWDQGGRDKRPIREQFRLTGNIAANTDYESEFYWSWVDRVEAVSVPTGMAVVFNIRLDPTELFKHDFTVGEDLLNGMSVELVRGGTIPGLYRDVHVGEATYTVGDTNEIGIGLVGGAGFVQTNAENGGTAPSSITAKERPPGLNAPGYSTILRIDDRLLRTGEGNFNVNYNLGSDENPFARDIFRPAPVLTAVREVGISARVSYPAQIFNPDGSADTEWDIKDMMSFAWGRDLEASIDCALMDFGAANNFMNIKTPTGRLTTFPDPADLSAGQINNPLEIAAYKKGSANDLEIMVVNSENATDFVA